MTSLTAAVITGGYFYLNPKLPSIEGLSNVQLQVPLRIYSSDGALMGEFGEKRRTPKTLDEIPVRMRQAFLSAEDEKARYDLHQNNPNDEGYKQFLLQ